MEAHDWITWIIGQFVVAAAIWGGIRVDIRSIHDRIARVEKAADNAHSRLDAHLEHTRGPQNGSI